MTVDERVAVWYLRYQRAGYELFDSEAEAAGVAAAWLEDGSATVLGAQYADGRAVPAAQWDALSAAQRRNDSPIVIAPRTVLRQVRDPFLWRSVDILDDDVPAWLGVMDK